MYVLIFLLDLLLKKYSCAKSHDHASVKLSYLVAHFSDWLFRERDSMDQRIGSIDDVIGTVTELVDGEIDWAAACQRLAAYDGVQAID